MLTRKQAFDAADRFIHMAELRKRATRWDEVGEIRRGNEKIKTIEILVTFKALDLNPARWRLNGHCGGRLLVDGNPLPRVGAPKAENSGTWELPFDGITIILHLATKRAFIPQQLITTGPDAFVHLVQGQADKRGYRLDHTGFWRGDDQLDIRSETEIFELIGLPYVAPDQRAAYTKDYADGKTS